MPNLNPPFILHNPKCSTSRHALAIMHASGEAPEIIEYLKTPPNKEELTALIKKMHIRPRELMRIKETVYKELGLDDVKLSDETLIEAMVSHPVLINRPVVVTQKGAVLCRPLEKVFEVLKNPVNSFAKENGQVIHHNNITMAKNNNI